MKQIQHACTTAKSGRSSLKRVSLLTLIITLLILIGGVSSQSKNKIENLRSGTRSLIFVDEGKFGMDYGDYNDVYWASSQYMLTADSFEYQVKGEDPVSMARAAEYVIGGDPGDSSYLSIEVMWQEEWMHVRDVERRLYIYFHSDDGLTWYSNEARTYDKTGEWINFNEPNFYISGKLDECFHKDKLEVTNGNGDTFTFVNLNLVLVFETISLVSPWDTLSCVNGGINTMDPGEEDYQKLVFEWFLDETKFMKKEQIFDTPDGQLLLGLTDAQKAIAFCWNAAHTSVPMIDMIYTLTKEECEEVMSSANDPDTPSKSSKAPKGKKSAKSSKVPKAKKHKSSKSQKFRT